MPDNPGAMMLTTADVLATLSSWLSPGEIAQALERNLRVPEAWQQLHDEAFLAKLRQEAIKAPFSPLELALRSRGLSQKRDSLLKRLPEALETTLTNLWIAAADNNQPAEELEDILLLAVGLVREANAPQGAAQLATRINASPLVWRSPLAVAWSLFPDPVGILAGMLSDPEPKSVLLAANALLANSGVEEAARILAEAHPYQMPYVLHILYSRGEQTLARILSAICQQMPPGSLEGGSISPEIRLYEATNYRLQDDLVSAREALGSAWESVSRLSARVADRSAELAQIEGDYALEVEARQHALRALPSPLRRSALARALVDIGRPTDALAILSGEGARPEEKLVMGLANLLLGERARSKAMLKEASAHASDIGLIDGRLLPLLSDGLARCGEGELATTVARLHVDLCPMDLQARIELSRLLAAGGDYTASTSEANLALALFPKSLEARRRLAESSQLAGLAAAALPHWQELSEADPKALIDLAACAIDAGEVELAEQSATRALEFGTLPAQAQVLLGKALAMKGDHEAALKQIQLATETAPHEVEPWIALADLHTRLGDLQSAGMTLETAVQAAPNQGALYVRLAQWMRSQGRPSEALEAAEKATALEPDSTELLAAYGDLLRELGHQERALNVLLQALTRQPGSWDARRALARLYEDRGEKASAWDVLARMPANQDAETHLLAGRIAIQAASEGTGGALEKGLLHLMNARDAGCTNPSLDYWLGSAHELNQEPEKALEHFRTCLEQAPDDSELNVQAALGLGRSALSLGQTSEAIDVLRAARDRFPDSSNVHTELSKAFIAAGEHVEALAVAHRAVELLPEAPEALDQLGCAAATAGCPETAVEAFTKVVELYPHNTSSWINLAQSAQSAGDPQAARRAVSKAMEHDPDDPDLLRRAAAVLIDLSDTQTAQHMLERAIELVPTNPLLLTDLATVSEQNGDLDRAHSAWTRLAEISPGDAAPLRRAADTLWNMNRRASAIGLLHQAKAVKPDDPAIHVQLARAYVANGELDHGLDSYVQALRLSPEDVDLILEAAKAASRCRQLEQALILLQPAESLAPERYEVFESLGNCLVQLGRIAEAKQALEKAIQLRGRAPAANALMALCHIQSADISAAEESLGVATSQPPASLGDAVAVARAAKLMGRWQPALDALETWSASSNDPDALLDLARLRVRLADAHWLYAVASEAPRHAPQDECLERLAPASLEDYLSRCKQAGADDSCVQFLRKRAEAAAGRSSVTDLQFLETHACRDPSLETAEGIAIAHLRSNRVEEAQQVLVSCIGQQSDGLWTDLLLGIALAAGSNHEGARRAYETAAKNVVLRPLAAYLLSRAWLAQGDLAEAITCLNTALTLWPQEPAWHFRLAELYQQSESLDASLPHLQEAAELAPEHGEYSLELARTLRDLGHLSEADETYTQLLQKMSSETQVWKEAAELALAVGDPQRASAWLQRARNLSPSDPHVLSASAQAEMTLGNLSAAREYIQAASQLAPSDEDVLTAMAEILARQGRTREAIDVYDQAVARSKTPLPIFLKRCNVMLQAGMAEQAIEDLQELLCNQSDDDRIWAAAAQAYEQTENFRNAVEAAELAAKTAPRNVSHRLLLGRICRKAGQLDRALEELSEAESMEPENPEIAVEMGLVFEFRRDLQRALEAYQRAIAVSPNCAHAHLRAGLVLKDLKSYPLASQMLERAVQLDPKDPEAHQHLAAVRALELVHGGIQTSVG